MAGLAASLRAAAGVEVLCVNASSPVLPPSLHDLHPTAIVFDLGDPNLDQYITLLREQPGLLLVGVDPCCDDALLLFGRRTRALSVADLLGVISTDHSASQRAEEPGRRAGVPAAH
jgi:hypothetical protein